jgi:hypothetical protein
MSPVEMRAHRATVANPASKAIRSLLRSRPADAATVAAAMPIVLGAVETALVETGAAEKGASEEFQ